MPKEISFSELDVIEVLKHLNGIVVSLDRLTSAHVDLPPELWRNAVFEYFLSSEALKALPKCREILSRPFSTELGPDDMDDLERAMQGSEYWSFRDFVKRQLPTS